jgi:hypothetical protein
MNYDLSIKINTHKVSGVVLVGNIVSASITEPYTDLEGGLNSLISNLLNYSSTSPEQIKALFLTVDYPFLYLHGRLYPGKIAHIHYQPSSPLQKATALLPSKDIIVRTLEHIKDLPVVLASLRSEEITALNINAPFFAWSDISEASINNLAREILGPEVLVQIAATFYETRYGYRENSTIANCLLMPGVNKFYDFIETMLLHHGLQAKIYTMLNSGMVTTVDYIRKFPLYSYGALIADQLLVLANQDQIREIMLITQDQEYLHFGILENGLPVTSFLPLVLGQLPFNLSFPAIKSIRLPKTKDETQLKDFIKTTLQNINLSEKAITLFFHNVAGKYRYMLLRICQELSIHVGALEPWNKHGVVFAPHSMEQEHFIICDNKDAIIEAQKRIYQELRNKAESSGYSPDKNWKYTFEEKPIQYLYQNASIIRATFFGPRQNKT